MPQKNYILTKEVAGKKLRRMAYEIVENNFGEKEFILAGIKDNGCVIARNIQRLLNEIGPIKTEFIDIALDKKTPGQISLSKSIPLNDKIIIVIDDVSNSGKTLLYAMKPFLEFRPKKIQTLVLVERRHNAFPVKPDYVGISIATTLQEHIYVEIDGENVGGAWLE